MRIRTPLLTLTITSLLSGCQNLDNNTLMQSGVQAFQAATLSDAQVKTLSEQSCAQMDKEANIAPADSNYTKRLNNIADDLGHDINGTPANYKVYQTKDVNAWAMANGCIRVYSGLMDIMTDNKVEGVLGREMRHVALGHSRKAMHVAYATSAAALPSPRQAAWRPRYRNPSWLIWENNWLMPSFLKRKSVRPTTTLSTC